MAITTKDSNACRKTKCLSFSCDRPAEPDHNPCCAAHEQPLCCEHYLGRHCITRFVCTPEWHETRRRHQASTPA